MKKKTLVAAAAASAFVSFGAFAESFTDMAPVIGVRAITERIPVNREECWSEQHRGYEERSITRQDNGAQIGAGTVLGAVVGGVIGHQFGSSSGGRDRGTAAGAIVGGLVGNQVDRDRADAPRETVEVERRPVTRDVERCRTIQEVREVASGYDVRYRYGGREFVTRLPFDPGRRLRVALDIRPVVEPGPGPDYRPGPGAPEYRR
jgi:uncharacterized protein YcfJ